MRFVLQTRSIVPLVLANCWAVFAGFANATPTGAPLSGAGSSVSVVSKNVFSLPVLLDQSAIANLREIELHVRRKSSEPWKLSQTIKPTERAFVFKAADDGEYQFAVVGVDKQGRKSVNSLATKTPDSIIAVDTQGPHIDIAFAGDTPEGMHVHCNITDANANPFATEFYYQTRDSQWHRLLSLPNQPERYSIPQAAALTGLVKVTARDRAGNSNSREMNLMTARQNAGVPPNTRMPYAERPLPGGSTPEPDQLLLPNGGAEPMPLAPPTLDPLMPPVVAGPGLPPPLNPPGLSNASSMPPLASAPNLPPRTDHDALRIPTPPRNEPPAFPTSEIAPMTPEQRQFINRPRVYLAYEIERQTGDSNKIQIWLTTDNGQTWTRGGEDSDGRSPAEIHLPNEGVTGVRLLTGTQQPDSTPMNQDGLVSWIELDVTKPTIEASVRRDGPAVVVMWNVRDKNLTNEPVDLYYAVEPAGPWTPFAAALAGTGEYRWEFPAQLAGRALYVRILAADSAGNTSHLDQSTGAPETLPQAAQPAPQQPARVRFLGVSSSPQP